VTLPGALGAALLGAAIGGGLGVMLGAFVMWWTRERP
jgi:hypothetical protein